MKRVMLCLLAMLLLFSGCAQSREDPFKVDTVVRIPVDPTDAPTEEPTEMPTEEPTEEPTEAPTEAPTEPEETEPSKKTTTSSKSNSSSSSKKNSSSKKEEQKPKETEPPVVETEAPTATPVEPPYDPTSYDIGSLEYAVLDELNANRAEEEVEELSISGWLSGIAYLRAKEVSISWSHTRLDGRDFKSALSDYGYEYDTTTELMIYMPGDGDVETIMSRWMDSKDHSKKIRSDSFTTAGIGVYEAGGMTYVICLLVG